MSDPRSVVTLDDLAAADLTPADVAAHCPHAVQYTTLDGRPCWLRDDLAELLGAGERRDPA